MTNEEKRDLLSHDELTTLVITYLWDNELELTGRSLEEYVLSKTSEKDIKEIKLIKKD